MPLLAGTDGRKMSKSWGNTIDLLDAPEDMYGKCMRISDDLLPQYIELACDMTADEKDALLARLESGENPMLVKKDVAYNVTRQYNGADAAARAAEHFRATVQEKRSLLNVDESAIGKAVLSDVVTKIRKYDSAALAALGSTPKLIDAIMYYKLFRGSNRELRRLFEKGAVRVSGRPVKDPFYLIEELHSDSSVLIEVGRRQFCRLVK